MRDTQYAICQLESELELLPLQQLQGGSDNGRRVQPAVCPQGLLGAMFNKVIGMGQDHGFDVKEAAHKKKVRIKLA
jgi:hypothetical protein